MGVWGTEPFCSDGALDLLAVLGEMSALERDQELNRILADAANRSDVRELSPQEVMAAVAVVAMSLPGGEYIIAGEEEEEGRQELEAIVLEQPQAFAVIALSALDAVAGPGGLWLEGWFDPADAAAAEREAATLRAVLQAASQ